MPARHHARTVQQLIDAAMNTGQQHPCGTLADHNERHYNERRAARLDGLPEPPRTCPECDELQTRINDAWKEGEHDAAARIGLYQSIATMKQEENNAIQAYADIAPVEPAVSYLCGYYTACQSARSRAEHAARKEGAH